LYDFFWNIKGAMQKQGVKTLHAVQVFYEGHKLFLKYPSWFVVYYKVIYPKYSKHWPYTVAHTINWVCSKMLNHGLNHGLLLSLFKFFGWKYILNWINSG
jgi:hypothetical protein